MRLSLSLSLVVYTGEENKIFLTCGERIANLSNASFYIVCNMYVYLFCNYP